MALETSNRATSPLVDVPWIVSVDDHVIEPRGNAIRVFGLDDLPEAPASTASV